MVFAGCKDEERDPAPVADFSYSKNNLKVNFYNKSVSSRSYYWDFGDGTSSTERDPVKTYYRAGTYTVTLKSSNSSGSNKKTEYITVSEAAPKASFSCYSTDLRVSFTNYSTGADSYVWDFGDGTSSLLSDPVKTYTKEGTYTVRLTAKKGSLTNTYTRNVSVAYTALSASFTYTTQAPLKAVFNNTSTGAASYSWDFGDGTISTEKSPTHRYSAAGTYRVTLVTKNSSGTKETWKDVVISTPTVYVAGVEYLMVGQNGKYYKAVCKDDDVFTTTWFNTTYTKMLSSDNLPYSFVFSTPVLMDGLSDDEYYYIYVYWSNTSNGEGTQILKQKMYTSEIRQYPEYVDLISDNLSSWVRVLLSYK